MSEMSSIQIILTLLFNLHMGIYIGSQRPYSYSLINKKELVNETLIYYITINLVVFTDFVPEVGTQYDYGGWCHIICMGTCISFNLFFVFKDLINNFRLVLIKYYKLAKRMFVSKPTQMQEQQ